MNSSWYGKKAYVFGMKGITGYDCSLFENVFFDFTKKDIFDISDFVPLKDIFTDSLEDFYCNNLYHKSTVNKKSIKKLSTIKSIQEVFVHGG